MISMQTFKVFQEMKSKNFIPSFIFIKITGENYVFLTGKLKATQG